MLFLACKQYSEGRGICQAFLIIPLAKHPRFHFHLIPTSSSWLNLVERWFRELTQKRIRRGVFRSVPQLEAAIHEYLEASNQAAKPFVWTAPAQDILAKVERAAKTHAIVQNR